MERINVKVRKIDRYKVERYVIDINDDYVCYAEIADGKWFVDLELRICDKETETLYVLLTKRVFRWELLFGRKLTRSLARKSIESAYEKVNNEMRRLGIDGELVIEDDKY